MVEGGKVKPVAAAVRGHYEMNEVMCYRSNRNR